MSIWNDGRKRAQRAALTPDEQVTYDKVWDALDRMTPRQRAEAREQIAQLAREAEAAEEDLIRRVRVKLGLGEPEQRSMRQQVEDVLGKDR